MLYYPCGSRRSIGSPLVGCISCTEVTLCLFGAPGVRVSWGGGGDLTFPIFVFLWVVLAVPACLASLRAPWSCRVVSLYDCTMDVLLVVGLAVFWDLGYGLAAVVNCLHYLVRVPSPRLGAARITPGRGWYRCHGLFVFSMMWWTLGAEQWL